MSSDEEHRGATPPHKKRKTGDASPSRSQSPDDRTRDADRAEPHDDSEASERPKRADPGHAPSRSPRGRSVTRSPSDGGSRKRFRSHSEGPSRSRSRRRSRSKSISVSRSRSESRLPSRAGSLSRTPHYHHRSVSQTSTNRTRTDSFSPPPAQPTPPPELLKPNYRPRLVLHGHTKPVSQVRISPNGRFIASASADATVKLWDAATGAHMDTLVGHMAGVGCLAWSPDSNSLATGSDDKAIRLWDRVTGRPKTTTRKAVSGQEMPPLRGHHNYIHCLAFSPKGNILASGSYDEAVFLWDVRAGRLMRSLPAHSDPVSGIDFCCDGTLVVSCSTDGLMYVSPAIRIGYGG